MTRSVDADDQRTFQLYQYLCTCLAITRHKDDKPNYQGIGKRLSDTKNLRKIVSSVIQSEGDNTSSSTKISSLTTQELIKILVHLQVALEQDYQSYNESYTRVLTPTDTLTALYKLVELTPEERQSLNLPAADGLALLQQALLHLQANQGLENYEMLFRIYKAAVGLDFPTAEKRTLENLIDVDELISNTVSQALEYLPKRQRRVQKSGSLWGQADTVQELTQKVQREIRRLLARSGNHQSQVVSNAAVNSYIRQYLRPAFVAKLAQAVVANERLTEQFPVYLKRISIEVAGPLPFADRQLGLFLRQDGPYPPLLHPALRKLDLSRGAIAQTQLPGPGDYELASQEATRVTVEFYIKIPSDYQYAVKSVFKRLASGDQRRIDFALSSTGIGGALSHVIKVVNRAVLKDIPCLSEYFSIAHDVTSTQAIIRDNVASPVWAHSLVKLCHNQTVGQALRASSAENLRFYDEFSFAEPIGQGDYCGFDFLLAQAQAALQARLQAIRNAGIAPKEYIQHLCQRTERAIALKNAWLAWWGYPFSTFAMLGLIKESLFESSDLQNRSLTKTDDRIYFDAYLSIVEALLEESAYRLAQDYLQRLTVLEKFVNQGLDVTTTEEDFEVFSGELIVRYLLCKATYLYVYDTDDTDPQYLPLGCDPDINREGLIRRAWEVLRQAQTHVWIRLRKYVVINEVSQGIFEPHYHLLAQIAFLRLRLLIFFPCAVPKDELNLPTEEFSGQQRIESSIYWGRLYLAEKSRLYAAADSNSERYACYAAMQCWLYLISAYSDPEHRYLNRFERQDPQQTLVPEQCFGWAKKLRDHALASYASRGRYYYNQIKEKSGLPKEMDHFGAYSIHKLPAIWETRDAQTTPESIADDDRFLALNMSLLSVDVDKLSKLSPNYPDRNQYRHIYLFGSNACYLFFARGMYLLCGNTTHEFDADEIPEQLIDWKKKLKLATRLLNMAWAIAEDGGAIEDQSTDEILELNIVRPWTPPSPHQARYSDPDVNSVRDLYPRRVAEIVDLGKIFAIACMVLRLYLLSESDQENLCQDIQVMLDTLHDANQLNESRRLRKVLNNQQRYNGHLFGYTDHCKDILRSNFVYAQETLISESQISDERDRLLKELFGALLS
ncbi:MAG: hypothetical protein ACPGVO_14950 [Spirulinaceae cyanobacterium]